MLRYNYSFDYFKHVFNMVITSQKLSLYKKSLRSSVTNTYRLILFKEIIWLIVKSLQNYHIHS